MAKRMTTSPRKDYKIGKGRPPQHTRWTPGKSGNPRGRPKGAKNLLTIFLEALSQTLKIQENGKIRSITVREAIVKRLINEALKGNIKATAFVLAKEPEIAQLTQEVKMITSNMTPQEAAEAWAQTLREKPPPVGRW
jgi:hypothetical protein